MNEWAENALLERGVATIDIDEPGIGEARMRGVAPDGAEVLTSAAGAIVDAIAADPRLDGDRVDVCGWSTSPTRSPRD